MTEFCNLTARNCKLFFKDKGVFFTSLITPLILLVLYATFLAKVYKNSFIAGIPQGIPISEKQKLEFHLALHGTEQLRYTWIVARFYSK